MGLFYINQYLIVYEVYKRPGDANIIEYILRVLKIILDLYVSVTFFELFQYFLKKKKSQNPDQPLSLHNKCVITFVIFLVAL